MSSINLYKIDDAKVDLFKTTLKEKMSTTDQLINYTEDNSDISFDFWLYTKFFSSPKEVKWNWLLNEFNASSRFVNASPQAILLVQNARGTL